MITSFLAACTAFFFKFGMLFSGLHYHVGLLTLDPTIIARHFEYGALFKLGRPLITYTPF